MNLHVPLAFVLSTLICSLAAAQTIQGQTAAKVGETLEETKPKIVFSKVVGVRSDNRSMTDLKVFKGRLFLSFLDQWAMASPESGISVMTSVDGVTWKTAARIRHLEPGRYLVRRSDDKSRYWDFESLPRLDIDLEGRLTIRTRDAATKPDKYDLTRLVGWSSENGSDWKYEGKIKADTGESRFVRHGGQGYTFDFDTGNVCGSLERLWIYHTSDAKEFVKRYEFELPKYEKDPNIRYAPRRGSLFFVGDQAYYLMPRYLDSSVKAYQTGMLGTAAPPYRKWTWTETDKVICSPHVVELTGVGVFTVVELRSKPLRTALCKLDLATGKLTELLNLGDLRTKQTGVDSHTPFGPRYVPIGLAVHDGHLWVSHCEGRSVKLQKIAVQ